jgi:putative flippase GtrA
MNLQTFRYAACGSFNMALGLILYYVLFKFILGEKNLDLGFYELKAHSAALFISFVFNFLFGFLLMKFIVFSESNIRGRVQLFRYFLVCLFNLILNYLLLRLLVEGLHIYPTIAQTLTVGVVVVISYLAQRHFSFKTN